MESSHEVPKRGPWPAILAFVVAYVMSGVILAAMGFHYDVFREPFAAGKLLIAAGVRAAVYLNALWAFNRLQREI